MSGGCTSHRFLYYLNHLNMPEVEKMEAVTAEIKEYAATSFDLLKLQAAERVAVVGSSLLSGLMLGFLTVLFIFFISLGAGFYLSAILENDYLGFVIIGGFYLLLILFLSISRKGVVDKRLRDKVIQKIFSEEQ